MGWGGVEPKKGTKEEEGKKKKKRQGERNWEDTERKSLLHFHPVGLAGWRHKNTLILWRFDCRSRE